VRAQARGMSWRIMRWPEHQEARGEGFASRLAKSKRRDQSKKNIKREVPVR